MTLSRASLSALRVAVILLGCLHALFLPVYEGPDEPFHLARARSLTRPPLTEALAGQVVDSDLVSSMQAWPCGPSMQSAYGCPPYGDEKATFNILEAARRVESGGSRDNYQAHQPPLYYLAAAASLALFAPVIGTAPEAQLLLLRLFSVLLVGLALCFPLRKLGRGKVLLETLVLLALLLPGAAESLARVGNDVAVFAWSVAMVATLVDPDGIRSGRVTLLAALGPLLKLTALPVVAVVAVVGWRARGWRSGLLVAGASLVVFPLQWVRGWAWGGTLEANSSFADLGTLSEIFAGLAHSLTTFLKTAVWLGGWSFFRAPIWLLVVAPLFGILLALRCFRRRSSPANLEAHVAGAAVAALGFVAFALGQHQVFGVWGGVGGWYLWGWAPWLALLMSDLLEVRPGREAEFVTGAVAAATLVNIVWFGVAYQVYG